jgi:hypothetical protein
MVSDLVETRRQLGQLLRTVNGHEPEPDGCHLTAAQLTLVQSALEEAAEAKTEKAETCPDEDGRPDQCGTCDWLSERASAYRMLAEQLQERRPGPQRPMEIEAGEEL